jgi:NADH-quinone oxidoreductase subunit G
VEVASTRRPSVLTGIQPELAGPQADYGIPAMLAVRLGLDGMVCASAAAVFAQIGASVPAFEGLTYQQLAEVHEQWPLVGRSDLYYSGTSYENSQGLGVQLEARNGQPMLTWPKALEFKLPRLGLMAFPVTRLYDCGTTLLSAKLLQKRTGEPYLVLNIPDAKLLKLTDGAMVRVTFSDSNQSAVIRARLDEQLPERVVLIPRSFDLPISSPIVVEIKPAN